MNSVSEPTQTGLQHEKKNKEYYLLKHNPYSVNGYGFKCVAKFKVINTWKKLGVDYTSEINNNVFLSEDACRNMVTSKICLIPVTINNKMECINNGDTCVFDANLDYNRSKHYTSYSNVYCKIEKVLLIGNSYVLSESCQSNALTCDFFYERFIWNASIVSNNSFQYVDIIFLKNINNIYFSDRKQIKLETIGNFTNNYKLILNTTSSFYISSTNYNFNEYNNDMIADLGVLLRQLELDYKIYVLNLKTQWLECQIINK